MKYFGVPTCPYCRKRVNLIRTWSLKRQGEYRCPRCGGISNIYLSPLVYVFAMLAIFSAGALYFFRKFVLNDITLKTLLEVVIPFAAFFLLSLFMVYLEKPVIKTVSRAELEQKKRGKPNFESRRTPAPTASGQNSQMFYDADEYQPKTEYRTGPLPSMPARTAQNEMAKTSVVQVPKSAQAQRQAAQRTSPGIEPPTCRAEESPVARRSATVRQTASVRPDAPVRLAEPAERTAANGQTPSTARMAAAKPISPVQQVARQQVADQEPSGSRPASAPVTGAVGQHSDSVRPVSGAGAGEDFFSKYDDPAYVERRLKELNERKSRS